MEKPVVGSVVSATFPYSNLKGSKRRPVLVLAQVEFGDFIVCQITSKSYSSQTAIRLESKDFATGGLMIVSYARPDKLFTADPSIICNEVGRLNSVTTKQILQSVQNLFV